MSKDPLRQTRYWDACSFLAHLGKNEPEARKQKCRDVLAAAERDEVVLITSSVTLVEVIKLKGREPIRVEATDLIRRFFKNAYIVVKQLDRWTAEQARDHIWKDGLQPKDAIHLATALRFKCPRLDTTDTDLLALNGRFPGLEICEPSWEQMDLYSAQDA